MDVVTNKYLPGWDAKMIRVQVFVAAGDVNGDAEISDTATGAVTGHVIMANTEGDFHRSLLVLVRL